MKKISDDPVRFIVSLKEAKKYGLSVLDQLQRNPETKLLFPKSKRGGKQCQQRK